MPPLLDAVSACTECSLAGSVFEISDPFCDAQLFRTGRSGWVEASHAAFSRVLSRRLEPVIIDGVALTSMRRLNCRSVDSFFCA